VCPLLCALQVKLLLAAVDQLAADGLAMSARLRERAGGAGATTADVVRAAGQAAGAAAAQVALEQGVEAGSAPAAASKAATVLLEAAGVVAPTAQLQELPADSAAPAQTAGQAGPSSSKRASAESQRQQQHQQGSSQQRRQQQREDAEAQGKSAVAASRAAAELSSMQILVVLPYAEVICFADVEDSSSTAGVADSASGHRWVLRACGWLCCSSVLVCITCAGVAPMWHHLRSRGVFLVRALPQPKRILYLQQLPSLGAALFLQVPHQACRTAAQPACHHQAASAAAAAAATAAATAEPAAAVGQQGRACC
jgi:hypothetical protein